jgi:hypothetical protein
LVPNEVVYDIDDLTEEFYLVKVGTLVVEAIVDIEEVN